jgi:hypothetical protein
MLTARPKKWYSWDYDLEDEGRLVAHLGLSPWRERGRVVMGGSEYRVRPEGWCGPFVLEQDGTVRARARTRGFLRCAFEIEFEGDHYTLKKRSAWCSTLVLRQGGEELGTVRPTTWYARTARVELSDRLSPVLKVFALWLALLQWRRDMAAA